MLSPMHGKGNEQILEARQMGQLPSKEGGRMESGVAAP